MYFYITSKSSNPIAIYDGWFEYFSLYLKCLTGERKVFFDAKVLNGLKMLLLFRLHLAWLVSSITSCT